MYTDWLWFGSLEFRGVWLDVLGTRVWLAVVFALLFVALLLPNLLIAGRTAGSSRLPHPAGEGVEVVRRLVDRRPLLARGSSRWCCRCRSAPRRRAIGTSGSCSATTFRFGVTDAQFGQDVGFYVFRLPLLAFLADWLFAALAVITLVTVAAHFLAGGIRLPVNDQPVRGGVLSGAMKAHVSVLLAALALVKAAGYWLDRYELTLHGAGRRHGAGYTDVTAELPAIHLLILISVVAAGLLAFNIRRRGWMLPALAVALWGFVAVVAGTIYPAAIQRFRVEPAESTREAKFIARNIDATRAAMGVDDVDVKPFAYDEELSAAALADNVDTIRNVRLWDPSSSARPTSASRRSAPSTGSPTSTSTAT